MSLQDFSDSVITDFRALREFFGSQVVKFLTWRRSTKALGSIRRWVLIVFLAALWAGYSFYIATGQEAVQIQTRALWAYVDFSAYILSSETIPRKISCQDCPKRVIILKEEQDPNNYLTLKLEQEDLFRGSLEEWFYQYQILFSETAKITDESLEIETTTNIDGETVTTTENVYIVNPDRLILFEPGYLGRPFRWLFAPAVLQWVLFIGFTLWAAIQISALYVNFVFELDDIPSSKRFILQYAMGSRYETVHIRDGAVIPQDKKKFIARVGGPGRIQVDCDSVALTETINADSRVIGKTPHRKRDFGCLQPFERLRITLPTRDQYMNISLDHKTREGIPIGIRNIEVRYNIFRDGKAPTRENPHAFDPEAVRNLVYHWKHTIGLRLVNLVQFQLRVRILERTFTELFAVISEPERARIRQSEAELQQLAIRQGGIRLSPIDVAGTPPPHARTELVNLFYDLDNFPVRIQWINPGTWYLPTELLTKIHQEAWKTGHENLTLNKKPVLKSIRRKARRKELRDLIQRVPIQSFANYQEEKMPAPYIAKQLVLDYQNYLLDAQRNSQDQEETVLASPTKKAELQRLINILERLIEDFDPWIPIYPHE